MAVIVRGKQASMQKQNWRVMHGEEQMRHSCELGPVLAIKITDSSYYKNYFIQPAWLIIYCKFHKSNYLQHVPLSP